jgi:hypothetical protein
MAKKAAGNQWLFMGMVRWLQEGETENDEARAIERLVRAASPSHNRLANEPWKSDSTITSALSAQGATYIAGPDNGSVMLVESAPDHFIFQTVETSEDGTHPEYGSRQFGFERLAGGAGQWYTRGASRPGLMPGGGTIGRHAQESGWTAMLKGMAAELVRRGGTERAGSFGSWHTHRDDVTASGVIGH